MRDQLPFAILPILDRHGGSKRLGDLIVFGGNGQVTIEKVFWHLCFVISECRE
jgi:hypothetical protein